MQISGVFEKTQPPAVEDIRIYIAYRNKENGLLEKIDVVLMDREYKAVVQYDFAEFYDISFYVWDSDMKPLMDVQWFETNNG